MSRHRTARTLAAAIALGFALAACSSGGSNDGDRGQVGKAATISHIHGIGVDSAGKPYVATHFGLIKAGVDGGWVYASADRNDHMGFSFHAGEEIMYRSGHSPSRPALGVESSSDGALWTHLSDVASPPVDFHAMAVSFADSKTLWGWDSGGRGTFRSTDGGKTWARLEAQGIERLIYVLAGPAERNVVLAGTMSGLYRSTDGGATWQPVSGASGGWVIAIAADPKDSRHMLVSTHQGMRVTTDRGTTWSKAGAGLPSDAEITSLAISPTDAKTAYAADSSTMYKTIDGGKTWTALPTS
jgi:hypothetical protein